MSQITSACTQNPTCPSWCTSNHALDDPGVRHHFSTGVEFPTPHPGEVGDQGHDVEVYASVYVDPDGVTCLVTVTRDAADCLDLSPARARAMAAALIEAANQVDPVRS